MPDFPPPEPPPEQVALRARVERLLDDLAPVVTYRHRDAFWESDNGGEAVVRMCTEIRTAAPDAESVEVCFDGLDRDIA